MRDWTKGAIFEFNECDYIVGIWFLGNLYRDLMCMAWKTKDGEWRGRSRWRVHDLATLDKSAFEDNDAKEVVDYNFERDKPEHEVVRMMDIVVRQIDKMMSLEHETAYYYLPVKGNEQRFGEVLRSAPFAQMKTVPRQ